MDDIDRVIAGQTRIVGLTPESIIYAPPVSLILGSIGWGLTGEKGIGVVIYFVAVALIIGLAVRARLLGDG